MLRSLIPQYALIVCFCCLMCLMVSLGICLYDVVRAAWPEFTSAGISAWQSDAQVLAYYPGKKDLPPDEMQQFKDGLNAQSLAEERRTAAQGIVFWGIIVALDAVVFALHWRLARRLTQQPLERGGTLIVANQQ